MSYYCTTYFKVRVEEVDGDYWAESVATIDVIQRFVKRHKAKRNMSLVSLVKVPKGTSVFD
jgi:hypothetical protein